MQYLCFVYIELKMAKRSFTIEKCEIKMDGVSRFESSTPSGAAAKASRRIFEQISDKKKDEIRFSLRETTQGSKNKLYRYIGIKRTLAEPKIVNIAGSQVVYNHEYKVKSCRVNV